MTKLSKKIPTIGVFGCGLIGSSWTAYFASRGLPVRMYDAFPGAVVKGRAKALEILAFMKKSKLIKGTVKDSAKRITTFEKIEEWSNGVDLVQESVSENYDIKFKAYAELDKTLPSSVLIMSSTSGLLISKIQSVMKHPERSLIAHPFNPPHLIPLVELVPGNKTLPANMTKARKFFESIEKIPVVLNKEVPGLLANRLAAAVWREAIHLAASGVASVEDVDKALFAGPGLRWAIMGQHMIYHLNATGGYQDFLEKIGGGFTAYWSDMPTWTKIPPKAQKAMIEGIKKASHGKSHAELSKYRDETLVKLVRAIYG